MQKNKVVVVVAHVIKSLNETTHGYCVQVELQFRAILASSTGSYYQKSQ